MRYALIKDGIVQNVIIVGPNADYEAPDGHTIVQTDEAGPGWAYDGTDFHEPAPDLGPVPRIISRRQFYQGLAVAGLITKEEALAALTGTLPTALAAIVNSIPDEDAKFAATAHLLASGEFDRAHPLIPMFAASQNMDEDDVDDFWRLCASLV